MPRLDQFVAVGVGASGALVDVSEYADLDAGVEYTYGRESGFDDVDAGEWSFTLDNGDGRFTPGNTAGAVAGGYSQALQVGAAASWQLGDRLVSGQVVAVEPEFPEDEAAWAQVRVTCDDALGAAGRTELTGEGSMFDLVSAAGPYGFWPHNEEAGSAVAADVFSQQPVFTVPPYSLTQLAVLGYEPDLGSEQTRAVFVSAGSSLEWSTFGANFNTPALPSGSGGVFGHRLEPLDPIQDGNDWHDLRITFNNSLLFRFRINAQSTDNFLPFAGWTLGGTTSISSVRISPRRSSYVALAFDVSGSDLVASIYIDGDLVATRSTAHGGATAPEDLTPSLIEFLGPASVSTVAVSDFSWTERLVHGELVPGSASVAGVPAMVAATVPSVSSLDVPEMFGIEAAGVGNFLSSALDALNDAVRTEQGHMHVSTSGTLTSPVSSLVLRERDRPISVTATFDVEDDLAGAPDLIHDLSNLVSSVRVNGPSAEVAVTDSDLRDVAGSASTSERVLSAEAHALRTWGQDRLRRGNTVSVRVSSATIDAMTTRTDRETDLLALVPGDRVRFTGLPSAQLGFSEWDGWLVGAEEEHTTEEHLFTFFFDPVLDPEPVFNDALFAAGDSLSLSAGINSSVTSMSVATTDATFTTDSTDLPLTILVDSEQMTVTAVTSATPQVFTVTRGVNGTTAASHSSGATLELIEDVPTVDASFLINYATNPSAETALTGYSTVVGTSGWAATTARNNSGAAYSGTYRVVATCTTASSAAGGGIGYVQQGMSALFTAGEAWTFSGYMRTNLAAQRMVCQVDWLDSGGSTISSTTGSGVIISSSLSPAFTRAHVTSTVPANADGVRVRFITAAGTSFVNWSISDSLILDGVMMSNGSTLYNYFDGSFPFGTFLASWAGVAHESWSYFASGGRVTPAVFAF